LRRIYAVFGLIAITYSVTLVILVLLFVKNVFVSKFGNWGYALTAGIVYFVARKGLKKVLSEIRAWWREKKEEPMAWRLTRAQSLGGLGVALLLVIPPMPSRVASDFVLEAGQKAHVRVQVSGTVRQVFVKQGEAVTEGQLLAVLENPAIDENAQSLAQQLAMANSNLRSAQERGDRENAAAALEEQTRLEQEHKVAQQKLDSLEVRAPFAGTISSPLVDQETGEYLAVGDEFCEMVDRTTMRARILVRDWELEDVRAGAQAHLKVTPLPYRTYAGRIERILPAAALDRPVGQPQRLTRLGQDLTNYFAVVMDFPNPDGTLIEGMTGTAKVSGRASPLAWQAARGAWRWVRSQVW
jgi:multidrug efflux pump subunit AcrA (membrane-fusion protein)